MYIIAGLAVVAVAGIAVLGSGQLFQGRLSKLNLRVSSEAPLPSMSKPVTPTITQPTTSERPVSLKLLPPPDVSPPIVNIITPKDKQTVNGSVFPVYATALDNSAVITKVEFYSGLEKVGTQTSPDQNNQYKYLIDISKKPNNTPQLLSVWAYDKAENIGKKTITYIVDNEAPELTITSPVPGDEIKWVKLTCQKKDGPVCIKWVIKLLLTVNANATDESGISKVVFVGEDGEDLMTDYSPPYTYSYNIGDIDMEWDSFYTITVEAYDNNQNVTYKDIKIHVMDAATANIHVESII